MNHHLSRHSIFVLGNTLIWGIIEVIALFRSRSENTRHPQQR